MSNRHFDALAAKSRIEMAKRVIAGFKDSLAKPELPAAHRTIIETCLEGSYAELKDARASFDNYR